MRHLRKRESSHYDESEECRLHGARGGGVEGVREECRDVVVPHHFHLREDAMSSLRRT